MREAWVSMGLDPNKFDVAAGLAPAGAGDAAPQDTGGTELGLASAVDTLGNLKTPPLSRSQARELADELLRAGRTPEEVQAALEPDRFDPELAPADDRTEEQRSLTPLSDRPRLPRIIGSTTWAISPPAWTPRALLRRMRISPRPRLRSGSRLVSARL